MACLIDLHTHTSPASACSHMTAEELIEAAIKAGLDGVAVTDHLVIDGALEAQEIAWRKYGFPVLCGVEARTADVGEVLVFGCCRDFAPFIPWHELGRIVADAGGVLIPAHPFRRWGGCALWGVLEANGWPADTGPLTGDTAPRLTAIEVINGGCTPEANIEAAALAQRLGLPGVGGSDAHRPHQVGRAATWFPGTITTDAELVSALRRGGYRPLNRQAQPA
jgi:predicted metal-dependent phosphoesterase TrpH